MKSGLVLCLLHLFFRGTLTTMVTWVIETYSLSSENLSFLVEVYFTVLRRLSYLRAWPNPTLKKLCVCVYASILGYRLRKSGIIGD